MTQPVPMYRLDTGTTETPVEEGRVAVLLGPVTLADYLQDEMLLQRLADGSLAPEGQKAHWAGSLQGNIDQLLLRQLAWRLKTQRLELAPARDFRPDVQVELDITRLDSGPEHPAVLEAQWRLLDANGKRRATRLVRLQEEHQGSTADQVQAQSRLLQRLSEMMAGAIEPLAVAQSARRSNAVVKAPAKPEPQQPVIQTIEPIRTDLEVFRF